MNDDQNNRDEAPSTARVRAVGPPTDVPVYNCLVLIGPGGEPGTVRARVANLPGLEATGRKEREALQLLIPMFKQRLADLQATEQAIEWLDPPLAPSSGEQQRLIAVHL